MEPRKYLKQFETNVMFNETAVTGTGEIYAVVVSGSRMLITLDITDIDPGTTVTVHADNSFSVDAAFETIETASYNTLGRKKRILSDFNNLFKFRYVITGGNATFKFAVALFDNAITTRIDNAMIDVDLSHLVDVEGNFDSVRIGDGTDLLEINSDGSIPVVIVEGPDEDHLNEFNEIAAIASGVETDLITYTVPVGMDLFLSRIDVSGENIARYEIYIDTDLVARKRTWFGQGLNDTFDFSQSGKRGLEISAGKVIKVKVLHDRPFTSTHEARIQGLLKA